MKEKLIVFTMLAISFVCVVYLTYVACKMMRKGGPINFSPGYSIRVTVVNGE